jgi:hypothetical protein
MTTGQKKQRNGSVLSPQRTVQYEYSTVDTHVRVRPWPLPVTARVSVLMRCACRDATSNMLVQRPPSVLNMLCAVDRTDLLN